MLRYYQQEAVSAAYKYCQDNPGRNPCIVLPTGAGKTHVIVQICQDVMKWDGRVLVLAHVKELLEQTASKLRAVDGLDVGIYSASLKQRAIDNDVIVAGVQSVYTRVLELVGSRPFNIVIVDEAHRIPIDGEGMYVQLLKDLKATNPKIRVIGLTATPYRTANGYVCSDEHFLNDVCYEASIKELIAGNYLSHLVSKRSVVEVDMTGAKISNGDYVQSEMENRFNEGDNVSQAVAEILKYTADRKKVLIFCCGIGHAANVHSQLIQAGQDVDMVTGTTASGARSKTIEKFKNGSTKYLVNVNVLTEGFDATSIDAVVLLRATVSPGLYYQMVGRGLRIDPDKSDCLVLDFGGNVQRHGAIDNLKIKAKKVGETDGDAPVKTCPECQSMIHAGLLTCPDCGFEFPPPPPNHEGEASDDSPLGGSETIEEHEVTRVEYCVHKKRGASDDDPRSMRVTYYEGYQAICDEWICVEHSGFAFEKAFSWWHTRTRNRDMPTNADHAVELAQCRMLQEPTSIKIKRKQGDKFPKIIGYEFGERKPVERQPGEDEKEVEFFYIDENMEEAPF